MAILWTSNLHKFGKLLGLTQVLDNLERRRSDAFTLMLTLIQKHVDVLSKRWESVSKLKRANYDNGISQHNSMRLGNCIRQLRTNLLWPYNGFPSRSLNNSFHALRKIEDLYSVKNEGKVGNCSSCRTTLQQDMVKIVNELRVSVNGLYFNCVRIAVGKSNKCRV
jgi:hypothetical protein